MKRTFARAAFAVVVIAVTGIAHAVPIYINFTGTLSSGPAGSTPGAAVAGGFNLETDRLLPNGPTNPGSYQFLDWEPTALAAPLGFVDIGDTHFEIPAFSYTLGTVTFRDGCNPECNLQSDGFSVFAESRDIPAADYVGPWRLRSLYLLNDYFTLLPEPPYIERHDTFDASTAVPLDIVSMPLANLVIVYYEADADYADGVYSNVSSRSWNFSITSVTRGVIEPQSVPEPGTLGLVAASLGGLLLFRRRKVSQRAG